MYNGGYGTFGQNLVALEEGNDVGSLTPSTKSKCYGGCNKKPECNSFAYCTGRGCYFKDKVLDGHEGTKRHAYCTTFYKRSGKYVFFAHVLL